MSDNLPIRQRLGDLIDRLPDEQLPRVLDYVSRLESSSSQSKVSGTSVSLSEIPVSRLDWPHAPPHRLDENGTYIVTGATRNKCPLFRGRRALDQLQAAILRVAKEDGWNLEAWAVFPNHYHFVASGSPGAKSLRRTLKRLHGETACELNRVTSQPGRAVWFNFWDTRITFQKSYLARLAYVHQNAVRHGVARVANRYPWCSAAWFERTACSAQVSTIYGFKTDRVKIQDDFDVASEDFG